MQALGSSRGGKMLFRGLGTGLGTTLVVQGIVEPMELGHLPYRDGPALGPATMRTRCSGVFVCGE